MTQRLPVTAGVPVRSRPMKISRPWTHAAGGRAVLLTVGALLTAGWAGAPAVHAEEVLAGETDGVSIRADAGFVVWQEFEDRELRTARIADGATRPPQRIGRGPDATTFDVGRGPDGRATIAWATSCSVRRRSCVVRAKPAAGGATRDLTRIPFVGGAPPLVALDGRRLAFTRTQMRGTGTAREACDALRIRTLGSGRAARALDLAGRTCVNVEDLDLEGRWVASLAAEAEDTSDDEQNATVVRVVRPDGTGKARTLYYASQPGETSNFLDDVALDGGKVYVTRRGNRQKHVFIRVNPDTGTVSTANVFAQLASGFARDGGRQYYVREEITPGAFAPSCQGSFGTPACLLVAGTDPWAGTRLLLPDVTIRLDGELADGTRRFSGSVTRSRATTAHRTSTVVRAGIPVALALGATVDGEQVIDPSAAVTRTAKDGRWAIALPPPHGGRTTYRALAGKAGTAAVIGSDAVDEDGVEVVNDDF